MIYKEQYRDSYFYNAKTLGYRSRAAFKLLEINDKFNLIKQHSQVLDLGCAPGGWSQVLASITQSKQDNICVHAFDLLSIKPIHGVKYFQQDCGILLDQDLLLPQMDVIVSDMAPKTTGDNTIDHHKSLVLCDLVLSISKHMLKFRGAMVVKIFQGSKQAAYLEQVKKVFNLVRLFKPRSSKKSSKEIYIIAIDKASH